MVRRRLPIIVLVVIGVVLGVGIAGVPKTSQTPAITTVQSPSAASAAN